MSFGDFGGTDTFNCWEMSVIFAFTVFVLCLVMLNLLIGVISDVLAKILENEEQTSYRSLGDIILDLEVLMIWKTNKNEEPSHLIFAEKIEELNENSVEFKLDAMKLKQSSVESKIENLEEKMLQGFSVI